MKIGPKLALTYLFFVLLVGITAYVGITITTDVEQEVAEIAEQTIPIIETLDALRFAGLRIVSSTNEFGFIAAEQAALEKDPSSSSSSSSSSSAEEEEEDEVSEAQELYADNLKQYEILVNKLSSEEVNFLEGIKVEGQSLQETSTELLELKEQGVSGKEVLEVKERFEANERAYLKIIDEALTHQKASFSETKNRTELAIDRGTNIIILTGVMTIIAALAGLIFVSRTIAKPIVELKDVAVELGQGYLNRRSSNIQTNDEVGVLASTFNEMADQLQGTLSTLEKRVTDLQQKEAQLTAASEEKEKNNQQLKQAISNLQSTQYQLVEAEKMAALGSLVAGVAHEINTPLGIGVSMASLLANKTAEMETMVKAGKMRVADLKAYVNTAQESSTLILNNLNRAGELVQSFKQVAVDQTSEAQRSFAVRPYLEEVLLNLRPTLKHTNHTIEVEGDETLSLNSYPGSFAQVVTNLVINSIRHAFEPEEAGQIQIELIERSDHLIVTYTDDGRGIPAEHLSKIFEPFFTTARQQGGSGLGLHLVYNLVTQKLKGSIRCESQVGQGTKFIIDLPLNLNT